MSELLRSSFPTHRHEVIIYLWLLIDTSGKRIRALYFSDIISRLFDFQICCAGRAFKASQLTDARRVEYCAKCITSRALTGIVLDVTYLLQGCLVGCAVGKFGTQPADAFGFGYLVPTLILLRLPTNGVVHGQKETLIL